MRIDGEERHFSESFLEDLAGFRTALGAELEWLAEGGQSMTEEDELALASRYLSANDLRTAAWMRARLDRDDLADAIEAENVASALTASGFSVGDLDPTRVDWECARDAGAALVASGGAVLCCGATAGAGCWFCAAGAAILVSLAAANCLDDIVPPQPSPGICLIVCHDCGIDCNCKCIEPIGVDPAGFPICPPKKECRPL